jgi:hypothetical protein
MPSGTRFDACREGEGMDDPFARFRRAAAVLFAVGFALVLLGTAVVSFAVTDLTVPERLLVVAWAALVEVIVTVLVRGLSAEAPWADDVALACCWVVVAAGVIRTVLALTHLSVLVPIDALAAAYVVTRRPIGTRWPVTFRYRRGLAITLTAGFLLSQVGSVAADGIRATDLLSVGQRDLDVQLQADCGPPGPDGAPPSIVLTASWSWARRDLFPGSTDGLVFTWSDSSGDGFQDGGYQYSGTVDMASEDGLWQSGGSPSLGMVEAIEANGPSFDVGIDLATQAMAPGRVAIQLDRSDDDADSAPEPHGSLSARASYVHLGRWLLRSEEVSCEW